MRGPINQPLRPAPMPRWLWIRRAVSDAVRQSDVVVMGVVLVLIVGAALTAFTVGFLSLIAAVL